MGRPSSYDPAYCEQAIECMSEGYSITAFAGTIGVCRATVFNWMNAHHEFLDAVKVGSAGATRWWEKTNRELAISGKGNATACIFGLKNRAGEDWKDIQEHRHEVKRTYDFSGINGEDLDELERIVGAARSVNGDTGGTVPQEPNSVH